MHLRLLAFTCALACATNDDHAPPIDPAQIDAWRSYATESWWLAGTEIPCDGVLDESWQAYTPYGDIDMPTCKHPDGESVSWFRRGDRACPPGATLEGSPPPGAAVECMRGETRHGRYTYWRDGSIEKSGERIDGEPVHLEVTLFPDGSLQSVVHFEHGTPNGVAVHFHPNGQRAAQMTYRNGAIDGAVTRWDEDGRPISVRAPGRVTRRRDPP